MTCFVLACRPLIVMGFDGRWAVLGCDLRLVLRILVGSKWGFGLEGWENVWKYGVYVGFDGREYIRGRRIGVGLMDFGGLKWDSWDGRLKRSVEPG